MNKLFISADIEGTAGIAHWDEANKKTGDYIFCGADDAGGKRGMPGRA